MHKLIFMNPVYKDYIWGGDKLNLKLNKNSPYLKTAESWEISANKNGNCKILNKEYKGKTLADLFNDFKIKNQIFGTNCEKMKTFPILIKFIDAKDDLSIQVHPDDEYANKIGENNGKNEIWYIIDCNENSQIIAGLNKKVNSEELKEVIDNEKIKSYLNYIDIKKGDSIYIEAGTIHAILKNNLICEIQQNCDITYRVYDWDRQNEDGTTRQLHKQEAFETIKPNNNVVVTHINSNECIKNLVQNEYFITDKINCQEKFKDFSNKRSFYAINIVKGRGSVKTEYEEAKIKQGDSFIIPANLGYYEIFGQLEFLKTYII